MWFVLLLAVVQGLTEFLPVSSSGHLVLMPKLIEVADQGIVMDVALHIGTLLAVLVYYRRDVLAMATSVVYWRDETQRQNRLLAIAIVLGSVPAVAFGLFLHLFFPEGIRALWVVIATTLFFGVLMGVADHFFPRDKKLADLRLHHALVIGFAQMCALIPGTSRSGVTMTAARFMGFARVDAARFSFLLGIPATAGAGTLGILTLLESGNDALWHDALLGMAAAFVAGLAAIHFMIRWLGRFGLLPFAVYRVVLGIFLIGYVVAQAQ